MMNSKMQKIVVAVLAIILAATMILTLIAPALTSRRRFIRANHSL